MSGDHPCNPIDLGEHVSLVVLPVLDIPSSLSPPTQTESVSHGHKPPLRYVFSCKLKTLEHNESEPMKHRHKHGHGNADTDYVQNDDEHQYKRSKFKIKIYIFIISKQLVPQKKNIYLKTTC